MVAFVVIIIHKIQNIMGMLMSYMGGTGVEIATKGLSMVTGTLYDRFIENKQIQSPNEFHVAILDIFSAINMALPGKHYDAPTHDDIDKFYKEWNESKDKKQTFTKFMNEKVNLSKADEYMMLTGIVAPPVAMAVKRTGQSVPQLSVIKAIPDVAFVPGATLLALIAVKLTKRFAFKDIPPSLPQESDIPPSLPQKS